MPREIGAPLAGYAYACTWLTPVPAGAPVSIAHPAIENPLLTVAPSAGASTAIVAPVTVSVTVIGIVIVRSGLVDVTSSVAVCTPGSRPAPEATTRNVFGCVESTVPCRRARRHPPLIAGAFAGNAAVQPVATTLGFVTLMTVVEVDGSPWLTVSDTVAGETRSFGEIVKYSFAGVAVGAGHADDDVARAFAGDLEHLHGGDRTGCRIAEDVAIGLSGNREVDDVLGAGRPCRWCCGCARNRCRAPGAAAAARLVDHRDRSACPG